MIAVKDLRKTYRVPQRDPGLVGALRSMWRREHKEVRAVEGVSFEIAAGERRIEEAQADLDRVLSQLDDDERELLRLRVVQGWSIPAIARWIAMEPRRVESRIRRVLARLRERGRA